MPSPTASRPVGPVLHALRATRRALTGARRLAAWSLHPAQYPAPRLAGPTDAPVVWERTLRIRRPGGDPVLEEGKRVNLALAAPRFDGLLLTPAAPLSFCRVLGPVRAADGYRPGVELRGGCVVPTVGGGLCLLSNLLFEAALVLGWDIVERHGHSVELVAPAGVWGLDATVRWPDVDLRVRPLLPAVLAVSVQGDTLRVAVRSTPPPRVEVWTEDDRLVVEADGTYRTNRVLRAIDGRAERVATNRRKLQAAPDRSCWTCEREACHERRGVAHPDRRRA